MTMNRLSPTYPGIRGLLTLLFVLWGVGGFILVAFASTRDSALAGLVTLTTGGIIWIGGMVFFGFAAALAAPSYILTNIDKKGIYKGIPYKRMVDGSIEIDGESGPISYPSWKDFKSAVRG